MQLVDFLRVQARSNRLANHRLHQTMLSLDQAALNAARTNFFPSLMLTAEHILSVDVFYMGALLADARLASFWQRWTPPTRMDELARLQASSDERLIHFCATLDDAACQRLVEIPRGGGRIQRDYVVYVLGHLFQHQTHHRGQLHAMLSGTPITPPQLDEFQMASEAHLREADMAALGWREDEVWTPLHAPAAP